MPIVQSFEFPLLQQRDPSKLGNGIFLNPYCGNGCGYENHIYGKQNHHFGMQYQGDRIKGEGLMDLVKTGVDLFSKHGSTIANAVDVASGIANIVKVSKDIDRKDKELYDLKRINTLKESKLLGNKKVSSKVTPAHIEIMKRMKEHEGDGIKIT